MARALTTPRFALVDSGLWCVFDGGARGSRALRELAGRSPPACCETLDLIAISR